MLQPKLHFHSSAFQIFWSLTECGQLWAPEKVDVQLLQKKSRIFRELIGFFTAVQEEIMQVFALDII